MQQISEFMTDFQMSSQLITKNLANQKNLTDLQASDQLTADNSDILGQINRLKQMISKLSEVPVEYKKASAQNCPFSRGSCESCSSGIRMSYSYGDPVKLEYNTKICYQNFVYKDLIKKSGLIGIQLNQTFESAIFDKNNKSVYEALKTWNHRDGFGVYIFAKKSSENPQGNGTGKTYAMNAMVHNLCKLGVKCLFSSTIDFLNELKSTYSEFAKENELRVLRKYINIPVLFLDDVGKEAIKLGNEWSSEKIHHVIDKRVSAKRPIIISSNFAIGELEKRFGESNHGASITSRLIQHYQNNYYELGGSDKRFC